MRQIYRFERQAPPILTEETLRAEIRRRKLRLQIAIGILAGVLLQAAMLLLGYSAFDFYPQISVICLAYVIVSTTGYGAIAVIYSHRGGKKP
ncbi:MAG: hypothetical protein IJV98_05175 [Clostridia bacterium]|nr:hypothetical protein [Clostridia bacterium]